MLAILMHEKYYIQENDSIDLHISALRNGPDYPKEHVLQRTTEKERPPKMSLFNDRHKKRRTIWCCTARKKTFIQKSARVRK